MARETIDAQCATLRHRGPDDGGVQTDGDFGFGMRRLSVVDIAGSHQPISSPDGRHAIVFNGEIYNYPELRAELVRKGHSFSTGGDTETILAAYREWGENAFARLDGMFALAIWDRLERRLTLARDPLGVKPLYVSEQNGGLAFASELKALMPVPGLRFEVSPRAAHDFFAFGHIRTDRSIYADVGVLPPGCVLRVDPTGEAVRETYWRASYRSAARRSETEWVEEFRSLWLETIRKHLLADVEVGAFLSGGIDSSAVVAAMSQLADRPIKTFTIGFPVERFNEAPLAEAVARHLGCDHTMRMVDLAAARNVLPQLQRCFDEPFADPAAVPTWYVSQLASEHVKVAMSGDGGDELFMGYKRHATELRMASMPWPVRLGARGLRSLDRVALPGSLDGIVGRLQRSAEAVALPDGASRFFAKTQITSAVLRARVLDRAFWAEYEGERFHERLRDEYFPNPGETVSALDIEQFAYGDLTLNLPCQMLTKVDRTSMAHSLEVRVPMLSPSLVEWALGVPADMKIRGRRGKHLLREAIAPWMPPQIADRRKQAFQIPLGEWFDGGLGDHAREIWHDSGAADLGFLRAGAIDALLAEHRDGKADHGRFLFALAMFGEWQAGRSGPAAVEAPPPVVVPTPRLRVPANDGKPVAIAPPASARSPAPFKIRRYAGIAALVAFGWVLHDVAGPVAPPASASAFVDEAVMSHRATMIRAAMLSQPEVTDYDRRDIEQATGIAMPSLPADWRVLDVQVYPTEHGTSVQVSAETSASERFSVFGMKTDTSGGSTPSLDRRENDGVAYWEEGNLAFAVVGPMEARRLLQIAADLDPNDGL